MCSVTHSEEAKVNMKKIKNESALLKKALEVAERYAKGRGYAGFSATDSAKQKVESLYRLLVLDKLHVVAGFFYPPAPKWHSYSGAIH